MRGTCRPPDCPAGAVGLWASGGPSRRPEVSFEAIHDADCYRRVYGMCRLAVDYFMGVNEDVNRSAIGRWEMMVGQGQRLSQGASLFV
ncbi:hypothetical protein LIA77_00213 [Sarocladium implicatum]|nr:hypothetical protein LIA77_00213 [Sarocladium implicatum]